MRGRLKLQATLEEILGSEEVYFQPPASVSMTYPAIVYSRTDVDSRFANNGSYALATAYSVTVIDKNPDSEYVKKVAMLPMCSYDRSYRADNLNHDVFTIYIN